MALTPAQMAALGAVNGYAVGSAGAARPSGMQAMQSMGPMTMGMDPWTAGINAFGNVATAALADNTPMHQASPQTIGYDNSGWAVTVGDGSSSDATAIKTPNPTAAALGQALGGINPMILLLIVGGGLAIYLATK